MNTVGWISFMIVWALQMYLFWNGIEWIRTFLNWAAPSVYVIMIALMLANFVPPANDLSNLSPGNISFRQGGVLAAVFGFVVGALWVSVISQLGIIRFVDTLGALLAPVYGIMIADYYLVKKEQLSVSQLFSADPEGAYYYSAGWNTKALLVFSVTAIFSIAAVWAPALHFLSGFAWIIGALLGGALYTAMMRIPSP